MWLTLRIDLLIFAGILLAVFLRGCAGALNRRVPLRFGISFALVVAGIVLLLGGCAWYFAGRINVQLTELSQRLPEALDRWKHTLGNAPWLDRFLRDASLHSASGAAVSGALGFATTTVSMAGGLVIILVVGVYGGFDGALYRTGLLRLVPIERRPRIASVLREAEDVLWRWMLGRLVSMAVIGASIGTGMWLLGLPVPISLGVVAGILTFVPYLGTFASALPPMLLPR